MRESLFAPYGTTLVSGPHPTGRQWQLRPNVRKWCDEHGLGTVWITHCLVHDVRNSVQYYELSFASPGDKALFSLQWYDNLIKEPVVSYRVSAS